MSLYSSTKKIYQSIVPASMSAKLFSGNSTFSRTLLQIKSTLEKTASHDEIYDRAYYLKYSDIVTDLAQGVAKSIKTRYNPATFIDIGCGSGEVLLAVSSHGVDCIGYDNSSDALELCRERGLTVERLDLEANPVATRRADVAMSMEVAEHIPAKFADSYVRFLTSTSDIVLVTAAPPGQGGTDHVNEQPRSYWQEKFKNCGFSYDTEENAAVQAEWLANGVGRQRSENLLVFRRTT